MATEKAVKFAAALLAETGEKGAALAANATGGAPTTEHPWKVVATLIDNLLAVKKEMKAAEMALVPPVGEGHGTVTGTVANLKEKVGKFGPYTGVVVKTDVGNAVWFIAPKGFDAAVGDTVAVTGDWKAAPDDVHFAFGKNVKVKVAAAV